MEKGVVHGSSFHDASPDEYASGRGGLPKERSGQGWLDTNGSRYPLIIAHPVLQADATEPER